MLTLKSKAITHAILPSRQKLLQGRIYLRTKAVTGTDLSEEERMLTWQMNFKDKGC